MRRRRDDQFPDNGFEAWGGYMQAKIAKLEAQFDNRADVKRESNLFQGISIYVNGYTKPSADELKLLMLNHGGVYHTYQRSSDFIIASNLPDTKVKRLTSTKIVKPEWITDSLAANCVLDYKQYLLYSKQTRTQPRLHFNTLSTTCGMTRKSDFAQCEIGEEIEYFKKDEHKTEFKDDNLVLKDKETVISESRTSDKIEHIHSNDNPEIDDRHLNLECIMKNDEAAIPETAHYNEKSPLSPNKPIKNVDDLNLDLTKENEITAFNTDKLTKDSLVDLPNNPISLESTEVKVKCPAQPESNLKESLARTAVDPKFLSEFYNNSRLHHISTLGAGFKQYVNELRETNDFLFPARTQLKEIINKMGLIDELAIGVKQFNGGKVIMHIDMDCFFVSVGLRGRPELRGLPVAVTHSTGARGRSHHRPGVDRNTEFNLYKMKKVKALCKATGISEEALLDESDVPSRVDYTEEEETFSSMSEIASCSYEARAMGIRNGMFMGAALRLCSELRTIPYDFDGYKKVAYILYNTLAQYTLNIEAVSCDEMYVDCTELVSSLAISVQQLARALRNEIKQKTGCPCSTGFGGNRLQARLATKKAKPDGQFFLTSDLVDAFMMDIKLEELPGVGRQLLQRLANVFAGGNDATCGALRPLTLSTLQRHLGAATGRLLYNYCRGDDQRPLSFVTVRKSVSAEVNYGIRFDKQEQCDTFLRQLCCEVHDRMVKSKVVAKSITLKVMVRAEDAPIETAKFMGHGFCDSVNKTVTLPAATDDLEIITREVLSLCKKQKFNPKEMRGIGIQMSKLESSANRQYNKNALKSFLTKSTPRVTSESKDNSIKSDTQEIKRELSTCKESRNNVAAWVMRTPPKEIVQNFPLSEKIPHKPSAKLTLKRSPVKSPQKSPSKKKSLGLTGRRRGRPPKHAQTILPAKPSASKVVMDKFLKGDHLRTEITYNSLDPDFLDALPEDIRKEVLQYYQPALVPKEESRSNTPLPHPLPEIITSTTESENKTNVTEHVQNPNYALEVKMASECKGGNNLDKSGSLESELLSLPWKQVREMLRAWLVAPAAPLPCDVELVSSYMQNMVIGRNIDKLIILLNFLKRNTEQMQDSSWSRVYTHILEGIQETMIVVYGKPLQI